MVNHIIIKSEFLLYLLIELVTKRQATECVLRHESILRLLNRLFGKEEEEHDFFSSTTATSVYKMFLSDCYGSL